MKIEAYSDGSGNTFDSDGGYGFRIVVDGQLLHEGNGYLNKATNNVAEITAAIEALKSIKALRSSGVLAQNATDEIVIVSDSQLVLGYASGRYQCKALHLTQLYVELRTLYKELSATTRWVKGHSGDEHNEGCDKLAKTAREGKGLNGKTQDQTK